MDFAVGGTSPDNRIVAAAKRQPQHAQFLRRVWLLPDWIDRYRAVYGPEAFDFTVPFRGQLG